MFSRQQQPRKVILVKEIQDHAYLVYQMRSAAVRLHFQVPGTGKVMSYSWRGNMIKTRILFLFDTGFNQLYNESVGKKLMRYQVDKDGW